MIASLDLVQFRRFGHERVDLAPGPNLIVGRNAQGKTTLLEAIHLLSTSRLLRSGRDGDAIQHGTDFYRVVATLTESGTEVGMRLERGGRKRASLNGIDLPRAADLLGRLPSVSFTNYDLDLVRGEPADRRLFLDTTLSQLFPRYLRALTLYRRALEQRNALLKTAQTQWLQPELFETWEATMIEHGAQLVEMRRSLVERIAPIASRKYQELSHREDLEVAYEPDLPEVGLQPHLSDRRADDIQRGTTTRGPHRDDMDLKIDGIDARLFGSQGQQRSAAIALKLATIPEFRPAMGEAPVLLLDDVFSELDAHRRASLLEHATVESDQVLLTCTEAEQAGSRIVESAHVIRVESGMMEES